MPPALQSKLLRALQEGEIEPLGSNKLVSFDARVIAATSRDLGKLMREGSFREDLFYRLNVLPIRVPPLRERSADILPIADMLQALRADHWLHQHPNAPAALAAQIHQQVKNAFITDTPDWKTHILRQARQVLSQATAGLAA